MKQYFIAIDGASKGNPGPAGIGVVIYKPGGKVVREICEYIGETTNNVAEYTALIRGLEAALALGATSVQVKTDSELLARQVSGVYKVKASHLAVLSERVRQLMEQFHDASISHVPREENKPADILASKAADQPSNVQIEQTPKGQLELL